MAGRLPTAAPRRRGVVRVTLVKRASSTRLPCFVDKLIRSEDDLKDTRLALTDANLGGFPPVTIINARIDPLRSDGAKLEEALRQAGVSVARWDYEGVAHEFFGAAAFLQKAKEAQAYAGGRLRAALD